jgi:hypothetical protein
MGDNGIGMQHVLRTSKRVIRSHLRFESENAGAAEHCNVKRVVHVVCSKTRYAWGNLTHDHSGSQLSRIREGFPQAPSPASVGDFKPPGCRVNLGEAMREDIAAVSNSQSISDDLQQ